MSAVHLIRIGTVAELRLDNPAKMNALTAQMLEQLAAHLDIIKRDSTLAAVLVTATGKRAFCTGADINDWGVLGLPTLPATGSATATACSSVWRGCQSQRLRF